MAIGGHADELVIPDINRNMLGHRLLAAMPEEHFETAVATAKAMAGEVTPRTCCASPTSFAPRMISKKRCVRCERIWAQSHALPPEEYARERDAIRATFGDNSVEAGALRDQALAKLFYRSGWTQEQLAKAEGCTQSHIAMRVRFGRFLQFSDGITKPRNLGILKFRKYWEQTDKTETNERIRFGAVTRLIEANLRVRPNET